MELKDKYVCKLIYEISYKYRAFHKVLRDYKHL